MSYWRQSLDDLRTRQIYICGRAQNLSPCAAEESPQEVAASHVRARKSQLAGPDWEKKLEATLKAA